ncbi:hypothetical protein [Mesobacillus zeae]|nr:hypothetical protein [Mesobacillus zeae]
MVNENHDKFQKAQRHVNSYIGDVKGNTRKPHSDPAYNSQENTDKSPGAAGRE